MDMCYRFYPRKIFPRVWLDLESSVSGQIIRFAIPQDIADEIKNNIAGFGLDEDVFKDFMDTFKVLVVAKEDYEPQLLLAAADINQVTKIKQSSMHYVHNDLSLSAVVLVKGNNWRVLTSEQKSKKAFDLVKSPNELKIPDCCNHLNIACNNWAGLFDHIGMIVN